MPYVEHIIRTKVYDVQEVREGTGEIVYRPYWQWKDSSIKFPIPGSKRFSTRERADKWLRNYARKHHFINL